jgi:hypothetical protein
MYKIASYASIAVISFWIAFKLLSAPAAIEMAKPETARSIVYNPHFDDTAYVRAYLRTLAKLDYISKSPLSVEKTKELLEAGLVDSTDNWTDMEPCKAMMEVGDYVTYINAITYEMYDEKIVAILDMTAAMCNAHM